MRKIVALAVVATLAACGSDSSSAPTTLTGSIGNVAFSQKGQAVLFGTSASHPTGCSVDVGLGTPISVGASIAVAQLTDYANTCGDVTTCGLQSSSMAVTLIIARVNPTSASVPGFANEAYQFVDPANPPTGLTPDGQLNFPVFTAVATTIGATPTCTPSVIPAAAGSKLTVTGSSGTSISGTATIVLAGGAGTLTGGFSASTCPGVPNPAFDACLALDGILGGTGGGLPDPCNGAPPTCN